MSTPRLYDRQFPMTETPTTVPPANREESFSRLRIEEFSKLLALCSSGLYVLGFMVVTSYLSTKGIYDQSLLSARYLMAGGITLVVGGFYYFMVWKKLLILVATGIKWPTTPGTALRAFLDSYYAVELFYRCCYVAALLCSIAFCNILAPSSGGACSHF